MIEMVQQEHLIIGGIAGGLAVIALCISAIIGTIALMICLRKWREFQRRRSRTSGTTTEAITSQNETINTSNNNILTSSNGYSVLKNDADDDDDDDDDQQEDASHIQEEHDELVDYDEEDSPLQLTVPPKQPQGLFNVSSRLLLGRQGTPRRERLSSIHPFSPITPDEETITDVDDDDDNDDNDEEEHIIEHMSDIDDDDDDEYATEEEASLLLPQNVFSDDEDDVEEETVRLLQSILQSSLAISSLNDKRMNTHTFVPIAQDESVQDEGGEEDYDSIDEQQQQQQLQVNDDINIAENTLLNSISIIQTQITRFDCKSIPLTDIHILQSTTDSKRARSMVVTMDYLTRVLQANIQAFNMRQYYQCIKFNLTSIQACLLSSEYPLHTYDSLISACTQTRCQNNMLRRHTLHVVLGQALSRSSLVHLNGIKTLDNFLVLLSAFRKCDVVSFEVDVHLIQAATRSRISSELFSLIYPLLESLQAAIRKHDTFIATKHINPRLIQSVLLSCSSKDVVQSLCTKASLLQSQIRFSLVNRKSDEKNLLDVSDCGELQSIFRSIPEIKQWRTDVYNLSELQANYRREIQVRVTKEFLACISTVSSLFHRASVIPKLDVVKSTIVVVQACQRQAPHNLEPLHKIQSLIEQCGLLDVVDAYVSNVTCLQSSVCKFMPIDNIWNQRQNELQAIIRMHSTNNFVNDQVQIGQISSVHKRCELVETFTIHRGLTIELQAAIRRKLNKFMLFEQVIECQSAIQSQMDYNKLCELYVAMNVLLSCSRLKFNFSRSIRNVVRIQAAILADHDSCEKCMGQSVTQVTALARTCQVNPITIHQNSISAISAVILKRLQFNELKPIQICQSRIRSEIIFNHFDRVYTRLILLEANLCHTGRPPHTFIQPILSIQATCRVKPVSTSTISVVSSAVSRQLMENELHASKNQIDNLQTIIVTTIRTNLGVEENAKLFQAAITLYPALLRAYSVERYSRCMESLILLQSSLRKTFEKKHQPHITLIQAKLRSFATLDIFLPILEVLQASIRASCFLHNPEKLVRIMQARIRQQLCIGAMIEANSSVIRIQAISYTEVGFSSNIPTLVLLQASCRAAPRLTQLIVDQSMEHSLSALMRMKGCVSDELQDASRIQALVITSSRTYDIRNVLWIQSTVCSSLACSVEHKEILMLQSICRAIILNHDFLSDIRKISSVLLHVDPQFFCKLSIVRVITSQSNVRYQSFRTSLSHERKALTPIQSLYRRVELPVRPVTQIQSCIRCLSLSKLSSDLIVVQALLHSTTHVADRHLQEERVSRLESILLAREENQHIHSLQESVVILQATSRCNSNSTLVLELSGTCNKIQSFVSQYETRKSLHCISQTDKLLTLQSCMKMHHIPQKSRMTPLPLQAVINGSYGITRGQMQMSAISLIQSKLRSSIIGRNHQDRIQLLNNMKYLYSSIREQDNFRNTTQDIAVLQSALRFASIQHISHQLLQNIQAKMIMSGVCSAYCLSLQEVVILQAEMCQQSLDYSSIYSSQAIIHRVNSAHDFPSYCRSALILQANILASRAHYTHCLDLLDAVTLQTKLCQKRLDHSLVHSCQAIVHMTNSTRDITYGKHSVLMLQCVARSKPVRSQYLVTRSQLLQGLTSIQASINAKLTSDDSLTQVYKRDDGEKELISTKNTLQKLYVSRLEQLSNGFDSGRVLETSRLALNQASQAIKDCLDKKSETLDLSRMNLSSLPPELALCRHVKSLSLNNNEISVLPYWFADTFKGLTHLDLSNNRLFELPEGFDQMKKLKHLDISHNKMEYFPNDLVETKLETLNISHNSLLLIPSDIGNMSELTHLDISNNSLMTLPEEFSELKKLKALCVDNNKFLQSEIANVARIFTPLMRTPHDKRGLINLMRSNDQLGYINTVSRKRSGSGGSSVKSPGMSTEEFTDINDMTELMDGSMYDIDYDEETASWNGSPPSLRIHGRTIDKLSPLSQSSEDDATDYGYDSDSSVATSISGVSTSALSPVTPADRVLVVPQLNLSVPPYKGIADEDDLSSMDSPKSSSATPRSKRMRTARRSSRVFAYEQRPELSPIYQMLLDEETRKKFRQFCQQESATDVVNCIDFWEGALVYKIFPDISSRKNKVAELYYTYLSSVGEKRLSVPTNLVDMITVQLEEELFRYKNKLPQLEEEPLPFYLLSGVISAVQEAMSPMIQKFKLANGIQSPDTPTANTNSNVQIVAQDATPRKELPMREQSVRLRPLSQQLQSIDKVDKQTIRELASLKKEKKIDYKERINLLFEILESERKYVKFLQVLLDLYYDPIMENKNTGLKSGLFSKRLVSEKSAKRMFPPNLKTIIAFNLSFLRKLEQRFGMYQDKDPVAIYFMMIADLFIKATPYLDVYISYLTMYESAMGAIRQYRVKHKDFDAWINKRKKDKKSSGLDMGSLLIMPVQRIPRYKILLENLLKQTPPDHGDYDNLVRAIEMISECALLHNEKIRETNNHIKVQQIGKMLKMDDLATPGRRLIREGNCFMSDSKQKAYLFNDIIILREKKKLSLVPTLRTYSLVEAVITGGSKESISFQANSLSSAEMKDKNVDLSFDSYETKVAWLKDMATAISNLDENSSKSQIKPLTARTLTQRLRKTIALPLNSGRKRSPSDGQSVLTH